MRVKIVIYFCLLAYSVAQVQQCKEKEKQMAAMGKCISNSSNVCRDMCTGDVIMAENCSTSHHCCLNKTNACVLQQYSEGSQVKDQETKVIEDFLGEFIASLSKDNSKDNIDAETEGRNLQLGGSFSPGGLGQFPSFAAPPCASFPQNCLINLMRPGDLTPPVNIPYCQRIACSASNPFLDSDYRMCVSQPGCYFDQELFAYRNLVGQAILPGVPVCHAVIRNKVFLRRANDAAQKLGGTWNPLLTQCLLNEYRNEIFGDAIGCQLLDYLHYFGHSAKRAGWASITETQCVLIGACWKSASSGNYCVYPADSRGKPTLRSSNDLDNSRLRSADYYGQPLCSLFSSTATGHDFLSSYHTCLATGCSVNVDKDTLQQQLIDVGLTLPYPVNMQYTRMVHAGEARPDNYKNVIERLQETSIPSLIKNSLAADLFASILSSNSSFPFLSNNGGNSATFNPTNLYPDFSFGGNNLLKLLMEGGSFPIHNSKHLNPIEYNPCPYNLQQLNYPGIPSLSGSFEGCCDRPRCYLPKRELYSPYSGISSYLSQWSAWSQCSRSCGGGLKNRTRVCIGDNCNSNALMYQTQTCKEQPCPYFLNWEAWGDCSVTCGGGYRRRSRVCTGNGICAGDDTESSACRSGVCPTYEYGSWTPCSNACGRGRRTRSRNCVHDGAYGCTEQANDEKMCEQFCGTSTVRCNPNTCCYEQTCLKTDGSPGYCEPDSRAGRSCIVGFCFFRNSRQQCGNSYPTLPHSLNLM